MAVHERGPLWRALKASVSLPGILPPVVMEGHLHVDGGTFDNLPVAPMRALGAGRVIACDVRMPLRPHVAYQETPSDWRFFVDRYLLRRRRLKVPHIMTTLFQSSFLASRERRRQAARGADLHLNTPAGRVGLTHWQALDKAVAAGYDYATKLLQNEGTEVRRRLGLPTAATEDSALLERRSRA
jgi:predicted acylesterase/phospholipase RssA